MEQGLKLVRVVVLLIAGSLGRARVAGPIFISPIVGYGPVVDVAAL